MFGLKLRPESDFSKENLAGARVHLRPARLEDWKEWSRLRARNRHHLVPFEPRWADNALTRDFFERRLLRQQGERHNDRGCFFLIFKNEGTMIGGMNINNIARGAAQYASLGYWIGREFEGRGYMAEALTLTVDYCFDELDLHRVNAACVPENERSKRLLLRGGFTEEGFARKYLQINGEWRDHVLFGMTIEDWSKRDRHRPTASPG